MYLKNKERYGYQGSGPLGRTIIASNQYDQAKDDMEPFLWAGIQRFSSQTDLRDKRAADLYVEVAMATEHLDHGTSRGDERKSDDPGLVLAGLSDSDRCVCAYPHFVALGSEIAYRAPNASITKTDYLIIQFTTSRSIQDFVSDQKRHKKSIQRVTTVQLQKV